MRKNENGKSQHWERQKKKIINIAGRLFWRKGYQGTTIDDIARAAKMNKATVYYYFKSKAILLSEIVCGVMNEILAIARPIESSSMTAEEKLKALILQHVKWELSMKWPAIGLTERRNLPPRLLKEYLKLRDEYEAIFRNVMQERIQEVAHPSGNLKLYSLFTLGLLNSFFHWYKPNGELSLEEISNEAYLFINRAISPRGEKNRR
jgi:AcrR family transcriptional regulator